MCQSADLSCFKFLLGFYEMQIKPTFLLDYTTGAEVVTQRTIQLCFPL